jgi:hypothetical protein
MTVTHAVERVGLAEARRFLENADPTKVRRLRQRKVVTYAKDMLDGNWHLNGETVGVNELGQTANGRHRFTALVLAATEGVGSPGGMDYRPAQPDIAIDMLVVRGIKVEAVNTIDTGMNRFYRDVLEIRGVSNATLVAAATRKFWAWKNGMYYSGAGNLGGQVASFSELDRFYEKNEDKIEIGTEYGGIHYRDARLAPTTLSLAHMVLHEISADEADEFLTMVVTGANLEPTSPVFTLRRRYQRFDDNEGRASRNRISQANRLALLFSAWNHWREGTSHGNLPLPAGGLSNRNFPIPR